ncbi:hypothetical protein DOT_3261 [Desulfosporosinus sp. OT]|nr:hypothetical protein DOT_3261 [Desulfosporosinus sp. OT]
MVHKIIDNAFRPDLNMQNNNIISLEKNTLGTPPHIVRIFD